MKAPANKKRASAPKAPKPKAEKRLSALDAAARILAETQQPMATKELVDAMAAKA